MNTERTLRPFTVVWHQGDMDLEVSHVMAVDPEDAMDKTGYDDEEAYDAVIFEGHLVDLF